MPRKSESRGGSQEEITRCLCGNEVFVITARTRALNANPGLFVQCERCHVWQHGFCMGFASEDQVPDNYYCEQCEPSFHRLLNRGGIPTSRYRPHAGALAESHHDDNDASSSEKLDKNEKSDDKTSDKPGDKPGDKTGDETGEENGQTDAASQEDSIDNANANAKDSKNHGIDEEETADHSSELVASVEPRIEESGEDEEEAVEKGDKTDKNDSRKEERKEEKKRRRRSSDAEFTRSRRRFRESEILQMVLEESAREAEEAAKKQNGTSAIDDDESKLEHRTRKRSSSPTASHKPDNLDLHLAPPDLTDETEPEDGRKRRGAASNASEPKRRTRTARRGTRRGMTSRNARESQTPTRRNKPKLPSSRSTLGEMIRRVAAILEFSSRAQSELSTESTNDIPLLRASELSPDLSAKVDALEKVYAKNIAGLENLTRQLLEWDERFNK